MEPLPPDPYKILGVPREAQIPEIRTAYRKLVLKCHPDKVQDPALKEQKQDEFQKVQQAYELLCDEEKRENYHERLKLMELQQMKRNAEANISSPRSTARYYEVRTAEPRPDAFKSPKPNSRAPPNSGAKMYSPYTPSRSYEDDLHSSAGRHYEDSQRNTRRAAAASYDAKASKREEERERERRRKKEEQRREDQEEKERLARAAERAAEKAEKENRRLEKEQLKKAKEKQRKREVEDKRSGHKSPYVESYDDDEPVRLARPDKTDKKKPGLSSKKQDEKDKRQRERSHPREEENIFDKTAADMMNAVNYMTSARAKAGHPPLSRSNTYQESSYSSRYASPPVQVPTPPSAQEAPFQRPRISIEEEEDEDLPRRSSAKPSARRSPDASKARDRSAPKTATSRTREPPAASSIVDPPSAGRVASNFSRADATPPSVPETPPRSGKLPRAQTMRESESTRPPPSQPSIARAQTYHPSAESDPRTDSWDPRGRGRSRFQPQVVSEGDSESEEERRYREARRRDRRHKTHSPEPSPAPAYADYPPPPPLSRSTTSRYSVNNGRTVAMPPDVAYPYRDDISSSHKPKASSYYSPSHVRMSETRPPMPRRDSSTYSSSGAYFPNVRTAPSYRAEDVQYSNMSQASYRKEAYGRA